MTARALPMVTDPDVVLVDGFDEAFVGLVHGFADAGPVACYDRERIVKRLVARDGMSAEDAEEYFAYNIAGAWVGDRTPVFLERMRLPAEGVRA